MKLITIIGLCAACLTTISFLPQVIKLLKTKQTKDISLGMYIVFCSGTTCWLIYGIMLGESPIYLANGVTLIFTLVILMLKLKYK